MSKKISPKRVVPTEKPVVEMPEKTASEKTEPIQSTTSSALKAIVAELEADPLVPANPEYPREYGEKIYPRYRQLLAKLKALSE